MVSAEKNRSPPPPPQTLREFVVEDKLTYIILHAVRKKKNLGYREDFGKSLLTGSPLGSQVT